MKLYFDIGNTRVKWWADTGGEEKATAKEANSGSFFPAEIENSIRAFSLKHTPDKFKSVVVASVASDQINNSLSKACESFLGLSPIYAQVRSPFSGVEVAYEELSKLGVDRWLAMLAAREKNLGSVAIIDAGSAITLDIIDGHGKHLGGWIAPGLSLLKQSLDLGTSNVGFEGRGTDFSGGNGLGCSTQECVDRGVHQMFFGFILQAFERARKYQAKIVVSGGDADSVINLLNSRGRGMSVGQNDWVLLCPNIVFDGLVLWFKALGGDNL